MKSYKFKFTGRGINDRGAMYEVTRHINADSRAAAYHWLYTYYEHITGLLVWENGKAVSFEDIKPVPGVTAEKKIINLDVIAKEWFDSAAGNSYFSARVQVNEDTLYIPFTYGYEDAYIQHVHKLLLEHGYEVGEGWNISKYCNENKINSSFQKVEKCKKSVVKAWGAGI